MATGYAYIRYSTRRQGADDKDSVTRQKASIRAIAARHEVEIPEKNFFYEDGVSAYTGANAKGGKLKDIIDLIDALTIQEGDFIFVESIDRLSRQRLLQTKDLVYGILKKGVSIVTTIDGYVYRLRDEKDALHQDIMLSVISTRAHEESSTKSTRRKSAWKKAKEDAEKGIVFNPNRLPYGVLYDEESNSLVVDKEAQKEFEFIFENLKRQGVTSTIKKVNQFSKINWTQARLKDIFETKYVLGFYMSNKKVDGKLIFDRFIENYYPKIIEPTLFLEAKEAMTNRKVKRHSGRVTEDNINIFRHSCFCARCGKSLVFMNNFNSKGRRYFYTTCSQNIENGSCKNRYRYDLAVKLFFDIMQEFDRLNSKKVNLEPIDIDQYKNLDEATLKEIESVNKSLEAIDEGSAGVISLAKRFIDLSKEKVMADRKTKKKIKELTDKKNLLEISVSNLNKSIEVITNGIIPASVMKKLSEEEAKLQELKEEIEKLTISDGVVKGQKMEFTSLNQAIKFFKNEEGRLSIINFLTSNNIKFSFDFVSDVLYATAYIGENEIGSMSTIYDNKAAPLGIYGFDNLGNVFTN
ncbi:TPA: recombinase family protein [Pseudomonas aeruginosa]|nr:recombinase family protein [Pseudomonas aeruginosa]